MRPDRLSYDDVLGALADGTEVDWSALESDAHDERARRRYRSLRLVARVAELHRSEPLDDETTAPAPLAPQGTEPPAVWGRLHVGARLASGAFGDVYRAHDPQLDHDVALKLLRSRGSDHATAQLLAEARALAKVSHPHVVVVHGADVHEDRPGLWMELIDGQTLAAILQERGRFGATETIGIGRDLCGALAAIHRAELVHGDIKAQNAMRDAGGRIVLMDFGAGRRRGAAAAAQGTPVYMAPEVLAGGPPTPQSDLYSLGVLLFTLLTDKFPYPTGDLDALRTAHADGARIYLRDLRPDLPDTLVDCIERALEPDPASRFATAGAMERALAKAPEIRRSWWPWVIGGLAAAVVAGGLLLWPRATHSLAVLAFASPDPEAAYLIQGLNRDVVRELQRFQVQVKTANDAGPLASAPGFEDRFKVDAVVAADIRPAAAGTALKVIVRRTASAPLWSRDYEIPSNGLPSLAGTIAGDIAAAIGAPLRPSAPPIYQSNPRAYEAYQRGRLAAEQRTQTDLMQSLEYFRQAIALDPRYAEAWAGMADVYLTLGVPPWGDLRPMEARRQARRAADMALSLNPNLAEAETSLAWLANVYDWEWAAADTHFQRAIDLNPQYALAHFWRASYLTDMGRMEEALAELRQAQSLEPVSRLIHRDFGWVYFMSGRYDDAIRQLRETLTLDPNYAGAITLLARSLAGKGEFSAALAELERVRPLGKISPSSYLSFRGAIEAAAGDPRARETLAELRDLARTEYVTPYYFALIHTALGQRDEAIQELQRAYAEQDATLGSVNVDPRFASLRSDPRFQALVSSMRFPAPRR
jgi:serine/threonine-protein kinase